jgi:hypothetical protein
MKQLTLNRTALSLLILLALVVLAGWMILAPQDDTPAGNAPRNAPSTTQNAPNNPGPTTGAN